MLFVAAPALVTKIVPFLKPRKTRALGPVPEEDWRERRHRERAAPHTEVARVETPQKRRQRISTGVLIAVVGVLLLIGLGIHHGSARFALSDAFDEVQLPTVTVPGFTTVLVCALLCLAAAAATCPAGCAVGGRCWQAPWLRWLSLWAS